MVRTQAWQAGPGTSPRRGGLAAVALGLTAATAGLLVAEAVVARRRAGGVLPRDPGYRVDGAVRPPGADGAPLALLLLGDSTVAGVGCASAEESLPMLVAERVAAATGRAVQVTGFGVSGALTRDLTAAQVPQLAARQERADAVVAVAGSNDVTHLTPPWRLDRDLVRLVAAVRAATPAPLVVAGIPRFARIDALMEPLNTVADAYARVLRDTQRRTCTRLGVPFVEIAREASPRFVGVPGAMSPDGYHPATTGYGFWADAIAPVVVRALGLRARG